MFLILSCIYFAFIEFQVFLIISFVDASFLTRAHPPTRQTGAGSDANNGEDLVYIKKLGESERFNKKFKLMSHKMRFTMTDVPDDCDDPLTWLKVRDNNNDNISIRNNNNSVNSEYVI